MKRSIGRLGVAGLAALASATAVVAITPLAGHAANNPPYEPTSTGGTIQLDDSTGAALTSGTAGDGYAAYAVGSQTIHSGDTVAQLQICLPQSSTETTDPGASPSSGDPSQWTCDQLTGYTTYPVTDTSAPSSIKSSTNPVVTITKGAADETPLDFAKEHPNTTGTYKNIYQLRLHTATGGTISSAYASEDITIDTTAGTWSELYPVAASGTTTATTTTVTAPTSSSTYGTSVTLTATVSPAEAGTVAFTDGSIALGTGDVNSSTGVASVATTKLPLGTSTVTATFTPSATSVTGSSGTASFTTTPTASAAGDFVSVTPARILDTRSTLGGHQGGIGANGSIDVQVTGQGGIPSTGVSAVVMNVTAVGTAHVGYLTVYPTGGSKPTASNIDYLAGKTLANLVVVPVSSAGKVTIFSQSATNVLADVSGYFTGTPGTAQTSNGSFSGVTPSRILDTRNGTGAAGVLKANTTLSLQVAGKGGVPATGVTGVVMNVTAVGTAATGFLTAYPSGAAQPTVSNLDFLGGQTIANLVIVPVGANGKVNLFSNASTNVLADVSGYFTGDGTTVSNAGAFVPVTPSRILDTRNGNGHTGAIPANGTISVQATNRGGLPGQYVGAIIANLTVVAPAHVGYFTAYPDGISKPTVSNIDYLANQTIPNLAVVPLSSAGKFDLFSQSAANGLADVGGYFIQNADS